MQQSSRFNAMRTESVFIENWFWAYRVTFGAVWESEKAVLIPSFLSKLWSMIDSVRSSVMFKDFWLAHIFIQTLTTICIYFIDNTSTKHVNRQWHETTQPLHALENTISSIWSRALVDRLKNKLRGEHIYLQHSTQSASLAQSSAPSRHQDTSRTRKLIW